MIVSNYGVHFYYTMSSCSSMKQCSVTSSNNHGAFKLTEENITKEQPKALNVMID